MRIEGREPGLLNIPGVGAIRLDQWIEDVVYDTATLDTSISVGTQYKFFVNLSGKTKADTNMVESGKLPEQWEMIILKYGLELMPGVLPEDAAKIVENSFIEFQTGNSKVRRRAPTWAWPIGFGVWGDHAIDEQGSATNYGIAQLGVPSPMAVKPLLIPIRLTSRLNFQAIMQFEVATTLTEEVDVRFYLYGLISRPVQ